MKKNKKNHEEIYEEMYELSNAGMDGLYTPVFKKIIIVKR
jgi:hypothetical protein